MTAATEAAQTERWHTATPPRAALSTLPAAMGPTDEPDSQRAPAPATVVAARYRLLEPLGAGGTGWVWLAHDRVLGRQVALKRLDVSGASGAARALHEARAAARIAHPNIVGVHDIVVDHDEHAWIVMEALTGVTLAACVSRGGGLPVTRVHEIAEALVSALETLHDGGVIHRDVKPSNIHLGVDGRVVLTDFGVAARVGRPRSDSDFLTGTLGFIAPESVISGSYTARSDMYGLGAALWFAIQGALPFGIHNVEDLIEHAQVTSANPPPAERAEWLEPMITGLLQSDPAERWTATRARAHLRAHRAGLRRLGLHDYSVRPPSREAPHAVRGRRSAVSGPPGSRSLVTRATTAGASRAR